MPPLNVAVIGYGLSAKIFHIPFLLALPQQYHLYAIVQRQHPVASSTSPSTTPSVSSSPSAQQDLPSAKIYTTAEAMLEDPAVDLVIITTPPTTHFALTKAVIQARKDAVVEKPFTPTSREARELIELAARSKSKDGSGRRCQVAVYQNRRWDADFVTLSALIANGTLGRVVEFESHFDRHRPYLPAPSHSAGGSAQGPGWKNEILPGGGAIYDLGTHLLDQIVHQFGVPERVTGFVGAQKRKRAAKTEEEVEEGQVDDSCTVLCHYDSRGLLATAKAGVVSPEVEQLRFWVRGDRGSYKKFHLDCQEDQLKAGLRPGVSDSEEDIYGIEPAERAGVLTVFADEDGEGHLTRTGCPNLSSPPTYLKFYTQLAEALTKAKDAIQLPVSMEEAERVIRLIELANASSKEGRTLRVDERYEGIG